MVKAMGNNFTSSTLESSGTNVSVNARDHLALGDESALSRTGHTVVAVFLGLILLFGFLTNFLVLLVFARFPFLRSPINLILLNISVSDMLVCIFGTPFSFAASLYGRWLIGAHGCKWYGFSNALFGMVSLVSMAILSLERYSTILLSSQTDSSAYSRVWLAIAGSWLYSLAWTAPPLLGWASYGPEGPGTTCSVQWKQRSARTASYVGCLFVFCLVLPLMLMLFCYTRILLEMHQVSQRIGQSSAHQRRERRVLVMVVAMVTGYLLCWLPYGVVALLSASGHAHLVTPAASVVPSVLAKTSAVLNPVIYVLLNSQFYRCFLDMMTCGSEAPPTPTKSQHSSTPRAPGPSPHPTDKEACPSPGDSPHTLKFKGHPDSGVRVSVEASHDPVTPQIPLWDGPIMGC